MISCKIGILSLVCFLLGANAGSQVYQYSVDLTQVKDDQLKVTLIAPKIDKDDIVFFMPKILPGTYNISDFGVYVHDLKAYNKGGKEIEVIKTDTNSWRIKKPRDLYKLEYWMEDTWDTKIKHDTYEMVGTNFEEGKNFSINTCGLFGYFEDMKQIPFELSFTRPANFYASTGMVPTRTGPSTDVFTCANADRLYDSPIMFCVPDTTIMKVANAEILISVYSPHKKLTSQLIARNLSKLLWAANQYLGGKLPVNKYAFLFYFNGEQAGIQGQGAWEHSYSSFYSMIERDSAAAITQVIDFASHEFFHIVTPLNICSKEVREFNFNQIVLSKHLWLYEGSTEYYAHHAQVTGGLISPEEFLKRLQEKISFSRRFMNDSLSFTELSKHSADTYKRQYGNVYQKGALICACLDLYLLKLSGGKYGFPDLKHDLSVKYGPTNYFLDDELFDEITRLSFPEIRAFFTKYVEGTTPLPYEQFFAWAGVKYTPADPVTKQDHKLEFIKADPEQLKIRNAWLNTPCRE
ncbi:MAG TPA: hypothetical protein VLJ68_00800 [Chitinophagaceae bacterium]|nr:hypothetical protein [Chitinophagaceae bacterium]